jgi:hypothetical protein
VQIMYKGSQWLIFAIILAASDAGAQQPASTKNTESRVDIFAGYSIWIPNGSVENTPFPGKTPFPNDMHGAILSGAYYFTPTFGLELSGDYHVADANDSMVSFAVGPIVRRPLPRNFSVFVHALAGAADVVGPVAPVRGTQYYYQQLGAAWGPQLTLGGGLDFRLPYFHHRLTLRLFQADYVFNHIDFGPTANIAHLSSGRFDTGIVWKLGSVDPPPPVTLACTATPQNIYPGEPVSVIGVASNLDRHKKTTFHWAGHGVGTTDTTPIVNVDTTGLEPGTFRISGHVSEGVRAGQSANCMAQFTVMPIRR